VRKAQAWPVSRVMNSRYRVVMILSGQTNGLRLRRQSPGCSKWTPGSDLAAVSRSGKVAGFANEHEVD
jgi:hypothetical protein